MPDSKVFPVFGCNSVPVVMIVRDDLWVPYAGVFIRSLLDHAGEENNYDIIIFQRDISGENQRLLKSLAAGYANVSIRFYDPSSLFAPYDLAGQLSGYPVELYSRILTPYILDGYDRVITVDADTLLKTDIARLMDEDLDGCCVGGVQDVIMFGLSKIDHTSYPEKDRDKTWNYMQKTFDVESLINYINTGLLVFDCGKYVQELDADTILSTAQRGRYLFQEQDTLNILLKGKIKHLDLAWNVLLPLRQSLVKVLEAGAKPFGKAYERAWEEPYLLHWAARPKPWVCPDVPYGGEWWQTALRTPFVGHIIARMTDEQEKRRAYYRKRYGKEDVEVWDPTPKGIDRTKNQRE